MNAQAEKQSSAELETLQKSRNPTTVITASGEVQSNEEAQVYVHDLDLFVTVQILGHACSPVIGQWVSGHKPHVTKHENIIMCVTENVVLVVVPRLS